MSEEMKQAKPGYYEEARTWARSRDDMMRASRRLAWIVAAIAVAVALFEAVALMLLTPLKTVEPYTLLVDRTTGYVEALKPLEQQRISADTALTQSFLVQYVIARESFDQSTVQSNYGKVTLWSAGQARSQYAAAMQVSNPDSPLVRFPRSTVVDTRVKSVSPLNANAALIRFETRRKDAGGAAGPPQAWVAVVRFQFSGEPMSVENRYLNPLGFQVVRYRRDPEALPPPEPVIAPPAASALSSADDAGQSAASAP